MLIRHNGSRANIHMSIVKEISKPFEYLPKTLRRYKIDYHRKFSYEEFFAHTNKVPLCFSMKFRVRCRLRLSSSVDTLNK